MVSLLAQDTVRYAVEITVYRDEVSSFCGFDYFKNLDNVSRYLQYV